MKRKRQERRREVRYPSDAKVMVHRNGGQATSATAADISTAGMLLHVGQPSEFCVGEEVTVEVELPDNPGAPFSYWGVARVVRVDGVRFAIELRAGTFDRRDQGPAEVGPVRD
jgi:hypothetical protein